MPLGGRPPHHAVMRERRSGAEFCSVCSLRWVTAWILGSSLRLASLRPRMTKPISARRALGEDALQRAAMHVQPARGLRDVAVAHLVNALDMLPAHAVGRHRI